MSINSHLDLLSIAKMYDAHFVQYKRICWGYAEGLVEKPLGQLCIVGETILQTNIQDREVAAESIWEEIGDKFKWSQKVILNLFAGSSNLL